MKLRNKKTGEVVVFGEGVVDLNQIGCKNVAEMMEAGWEDYEEPKFIRDYWFIDSCGGINKQEADILGANRREIGNYFETKEEAEKAVEKLKAWKRLREKGFKFEWWLSEPSSDHIEFYMDSWEWDSEATKDLDLLFEAKNK